jgi:hypothetical protein
MRPVHCFRSGDRVQSQTSQTLPGLQGTFRTSLPKPDFGIGTVNHIRAVVLLSDYGVKDLSPGMDQKKIIIVIFPDIFEQRNPPQYPSAYRGVIASSNFMVLIIAHFKSRDVQSLVSDDLQISGASGDNLLTPLSPPTALSTISQESSSPIFPSLTSLSLRYATVSVLFCRPAKSPRSFPCPDAVCTMVFMGRTRKSAEQSRQSPCLSAVG